MLSLLLAPWRAAGRGQYPSDGPEARQDGALDALFIHVRQTARTQIPELGQDPVKGFARDPFGEHLEVVVQFGQQEMFFDRNLFHGPTSFDICQ